MAAVVGTPVAGEAHVVISAHNFGDIERAVAAQVRSFDEVAVVKTLDVADVGEGDAVVEITNHLREVIVRIWAERAAAQGQTIAGAVHHFHDGFEVGVIFDDARQAEDGKRRIVGVDTHLDAGSFGSRDDRFKEIFEVFAQIVFAYVFISVKELVEMREPLRFPTGQGQPLRTFSDAFHQLLRIKVFHRTVVVEERG